MKQDVILSMDYVAGYIICTLVILESYSYMEYNCWEKFEAFLSNYITDNSLIITDLMLRKYLDITEAPI